MSAPMSALSAHGPLTVLVVDDRDTSAVIARYGHRVLGAVTVEEALALSASDPPDAAVLDPMMPQMNGVELARRLSAGAPKGRAPVLVAVTGWRGTEVRRWAAEGGFGAVLLKPVEPAELFAVLCGVGLRRGGEPLPPPIRPRRTA